MNEKILVLDFGGQYSQLIARRIRDLHVYAEIRTYDQISAEEIARNDYRGIIFTGGPGSVYEEDAPRCDPAVLDVGIPILGICYGHQLLAYLAGGEVCSAADGSEYGGTMVTITENKLFEGVDKESICWMSHTDHVDTPPTGFQCIARTGKCLCAAMCDDVRKLYGVQFHPEVGNTVYGKQMLSNFLYKVCECSGDWRMENFAEESIRYFRKKLAGKKVLMALSGGVDSAVAAVLLQKAIGNELTCIFVDHGLLRKNEGKLVKEVFDAHLGMKLICVDAKERFLCRLSGIVEPEEKRRVIGEEFIRVFEEEAKKLGSIQVLAQGTIYPDVVESGKGDAAVIKSHHNVGGLPDRMDFEEVVEPLRALFKDEVRRVGTELGIPYDLVWRQPFPGPGLAVRIIGEVTEEKLELLREADAIFCQELEESGSCKRADQYFAVLTDTMSVGVKGDNRTYGHTVALRAVTTDDFMTAEWTRLPYDVMERASSRISNKVSGIARVVYDITSKPPATVEWE